MEAIALLISSLLFGGMTLYSFGFAAFVFSTLPPDLSRKTIRLAFPHFYFFVFSMSSISAVLLYFFDPIAAVVMGIIAATTIPTRQLLMPAINAASDTGARQRFKLLHSFSVLITLGQITGSAYVLLRFL